ncbi:ECF transporter S component [Oscillospiraceae bacterium CM]|nr:ECF transporter S component [Oscillospiraceae bacterium CM]
MSNNVRRITYTAVAAAIVFTVTRLVVIPIGTSGGYVNLGDITIYISAYLLGGPIAAVAAAIGSALSDLTTPWAFYAPATFVIKGLMGLAAGAILKRSRGFAMFALSSFLGGAIMITGYALFDTITVGWATALANAIPFNLFQWGGCVIVALVLYPFLIRILKVTHFDELR